MKLKSLAVITLLVIGCSFASAQSFGFASVGGGLYCNFEVLQQLSPYTVWQGLDDLSACGASVNGTIVGIKGGLAAAGNPAGFAVSGVTYADNIYDAEALTYTGAQWDVTTDLKCNKVKKGVYSGKYSWIGFASVSGLVFGDNYGYLSCTIPGKNEAPTKGPSTGKYSELPARK